MQIKRFELVFAGDAIEADPVGITVPANAAAVVAAMIPAGTPVEMAVALWLDTRNHPIGWSKVSDGGFAWSAMGVSEVMTMALYAGARGIVLGHNHPSGDPTPSRDDVVITRRLAEAGAILKVAVLDHIIIGTGPSARGRWVSLRERGLI